MALDLNADIDAAEGVSKQEALGTTRVIDAVEDSEQQAEIQHQPDARTKPGTLKLGRGLRAARAVEAVAPLYAGLDGGFNNCTGGSIILLPVEKTPDAMG